MPDDRTDDRTLGEAFRLIADTRDACARRAAAHVQDGLYQSEMASLRRDLDAASTAARRDVTGAAESIRHEMGRFEDAITRRADANESAIRALNEQRRWLWRAVVTAIVGPLLTGTFLYLLLGGPA